MIRIDGRLLLLLGLFLTGCIPCPRTAIVQPPLEFQLVDDSGQPVEGVVRLTRLSVPHRVHHATDDFLTDPQGALKIPMEKKREWVYPLMMHGVHYYYWEYCVDAPGYSAVTDEIRDPTQWADSLSVVLEPGDLDCAAGSGTHLVPPRTPSPSGK
jgi:hypothetical protein